jgi:hypothetical protein
MGGSLNKTRRGTKDPSLNLTISSNVQILRKIIDEEARLLLMEGSVSAEEAAEWESELARDFLDLTATDEEMAAMEAEEALRIEEAELQRQIAAYEARPGTPEAQGFGQFERTASEDFEMDDVGMELDETACGNCGVVVGDDVEYCRVCGASRRDGA